MEGPSMTTAGLTSLIVGLIIGYVGQRSRMCFVGGLRDFILARDVFLLKGLIAFGLTAWVAFPLFHFLVGSTPVDFVAVDNLTLLSTILGGFGVGVISVLANGCPFRQHVLAAQGVASSAAYLLGFYAGAVIFHTLVLPIILTLLG